MTPARGAVTLTGKQVTGGGAGALTFHRLTETDPIAQTLPQLATTAKNEASLQLAGQVTDADGALYSLVGNNNAITLTKTDAGGTKLWTRDLGHANASLRLAATADGLAIVATDGRTLSVRQISANGKAGADAVVPVWTGFTLDAAIGAPGGSVVIGGAAGGRAVLLRVDAHGQTTASATVGSPGFRLTGLASKGAGVIAVGNENEIGHAIALDPDLVTQTAQWTLASGRAGVVASDASGDRVFVALNDPGGASVAAVNVASGDVIQSARAVGRRIDSLAVGDNQVVAGERDGSGNAYAATYAQADLAARSTLTAGVSSGAVSVSVSSNGDSILSRLGLRSGTVADATRSLIVNATDASAGDSFQVQIGGRRTTIVIEADDTAASIVFRLNHALGSNGSARAIRGAGGTTLSIDARTPDGVALLPSPAGRDALSGLGLQPQRLTSARIRSGSTPLIQPGGIFALDLDTSLDIGTRKSAAQVADRLKTAGDTLRSAYRSFYWDPTKQAVVEAQGRGKTSASDAARLATYREALRRLGR